MKGRRGKERDGGKDQEGRRRRKREGGEKQRER